MSVSVSLLMFVIASRIVTAYHNIVLFITVHGPFEFRSQVVLPAHKKSTKKGRNQKGKTQAGKCLLG